MVSQETLLKFDSTDSRLIQLISQGLHLDVETRNKVKDLKEKISDLELEFRNNCTEESTKLFFAKEQLDGVTENLLNSFPKVGQSWSADLF